jgi:hypothetical protein
MTDMKVNVQGNRWYLGVFADPVSAAICYDKEAIRAYGAHAALNFPSGCNSWPTSAGMVGQPPLLPGNGEFGEGEPSSLPAGSPPARAAGGNPVSYSGPKVRVTSILI